MLKLTVLIFIFFNVLTVDGQNLFKNIEIGIGIARQSQDKRLFDYKLANFVEPVSTRFDIEYLASISKNILSEKRLNISLGVGYSVFQTDFRRPFDHSYFTGKKTYELRFVEKYTIHNLLTNIDLKIILLNQKSHVLYINFPIITRFSLNKSMKNGNWHYNKWKLEFNNIEAYSGLGYKFRKLGLNLGYNIYNIQKIDRVIFDKHFYRNSDISKKEYESRNINKLLLSLSFQIG